METNGTPIHFSPVSLSSSLPLSLALSFSLTHSLEVVFSRFIHVSIAFYLFFNCHLTFYQKLTHCTLDHPLSHTHPHACAGIPSAGGGSRQSCRPLPPHDAPARGDRPSADIPRQPFELSLFVIPIAILLTSLSIMSLMAITSPTGYNLPISSISNISNISSLMFSFFCSVFAALAPCPMRPVQET
jgi:hypothetical protein